MWTMPRLTDHGSLEQLIAEAQARYEHAKRRHAHPETVRELERKLVSLEGDFSEAQEDNA